MSATKTFAAVFVGMLGLTWAARCQESSKPESATDLEAALKKASGDDKYRMLLHQIKSPVDREKFTEYHDFGKRDLRQYGNVENLQPGYWVYVHPYWYVWRDKSTDVKPKRNWGPEQVEGEPNTKDAGDIPTAWASRNQDGQDEWLLCEYEKPVIPSAVLVYETYNPGAVDKITAFKLDGTEVTVWRGKDPTPRGSGIGISVFPLKIDFKTNRVRVHVASKSVPGWNEIDAVGLRDGKKKVQWAQTVEASTTFAVQSVPTAPPPPARNAVNKQIDDLKEEVEQLKSQMNQMKTTLDEIKRLLKEKK